MCIGKVWFICMLRLGEGGCARPRGSCTTARHSRGCCLPRRRWGSSAQELRTFTQLILKHCGRCNAPSLHLTFLLTIRFRPSPTAAQPREWHCRRCALPCGGSVSTDSPSPSPHLTHKDFSSGGATKASKQSDTLSRLPYHRRIARPAP
jgi:hypothetical protein